MLGKFNKKTFGRCQLYVLCLLQVVLADKPLISEETDLIEPTLLDELICHISSLASVYHKPPMAFVEGRAAYGARRALPGRSAT